ncbi:uncharacterized protein [Primulina huaijiensis]|uniref:uncharacterized protein n=1 Tax=Primulina huaijiensis TaxID=1492673 RepID=UPI003CC70467
MNLLIWNVRGLRGSEFQQRLHAYVKEKRVKILAILEPMIDLDVRFMTRRFGFSRVISNSSGQIWVFFAEDVRVECLLDHIQFIHLWDSMLQVKPDQGPWLVGGDFNVVINASECLGSSDGRLLPMEEFNHFILDSVLVDAGFGVFVHVDEQDHLEAFRSGFCMVRLNWNLPCHLDGMHRLFVKLKRLKSHLKWWNKSVSGNLFAKLAEAEQAVRLAEEVCEVDLSELH